MTFEYSHFVSTLPPQLKQNFAKRLEILNPVLSKILIRELKLENKILDVRIEAGGQANLTVLLQNKFHQEYDSHLYDKLVITDAHDHGVYYSAKSLPNQVLVAPYL